MEKERSTSLLGHGRMLSPSARFSGFSSVGSSFGGRGETSRSVAPAPMLAMPEFGRFRQEFSFGPGQISHDHSKMMDVPHMNGGHRRAQSDLPCLPDKVRFGSSPNAVGAFDGPELSEENVNENGEDLIAIYMDMDKLNSSMGFYGLEGGGESVQATPQAPYPNENMMVSPSEKPIVKHQQSLSFDGLTSTKPELLISSPEWTLSAESRKALSAAKLAEIALVNPKQAKRILGNRQSAARSKERKRRYVSELEQKVKDLETKVTALSAQLEMAKRDAISLIVENNELKARLQFMEKQVQLQDAVNNALNDEVECLRVTGGMGNPNGGHMTNNGADFDSNQQVYPYTNELHSHHYPSTAAAPNSSSTAPKPGAASTTHEKQGTRFQRPMDQVKWPSGSVGVLI